MKVLHVIDSGGLYGAEQVLLHLTEEQRRGGMQPVIASIGRVGEGTKALELAARQRGIPVAPFRMRPGPNFRGAQRLLAYARRERIDLFHSHGYKGNILLGLIPRSWRGAPLLTTLHGWTDGGRLSRVACYEWCDRLLLGRLDAVVVVSRSMCAHPWLVDRRLPLHVVCNGIPAAPPSAPLEEAIVDFCRQGFCVGAIGRLAPEKGFDRLIEAFAGVVAADRTARLIILGEGSERPALEALVRRFALDRHVALPGFRAGAAGYLRHFDLFVLSSATEGLPLAVLEAMRAGVPILATPVGAIPELLAEGEAGYLLAAPDAASIAAAIAAIRQEPQEVWRRAERARQRVRDLYSSAAMATGYAAVYRHLLGGRA